ncbi:MAG: hypothetical protein NT118_12960 [Lentisphaerae bacterium]|nr:hypothetical protein [Lentisphaerota bacterium]
MKKTVITVFCATCFICLTGASADAPPPAKEADTSLKTEIFTPKIDGDKIVSGNKALQVKNDGTLLLFAWNDQKPIQIDFGFLSDFGYPSLAPGNKDAASDYDKASQTFTYTASLPLDKANADTAKYFKVTRKATLTPEGIINVSLSWDIPENGKQNFKMAYCNLRWPGNELGKKVLCAGKEYTVNRMEGKDQYWFTGTNNNEELEFFPDLPKESFKLTPKDLSLVLVSSIVASGDMMQVRINPAKDRNSISFDLDIRNAVKE